MPERPMSFSDRAYLRDRRVETRNLVIMLGMGSPPESEMRRVCKAFLPAVDDVLLELVGEQMLGGIREYPPARA